MRAIGPCGVFAAFCAAYILQLVILYSDYQVAVDEPINVAYGEYVKRHFFPFLGEPELYAGYAFSDPDSPFALKLLYPPTYVFFSSMLSEALPRGLDAYQATHLINGLFGLVLIGSIWKLGTLIGGSWTGLTAVLLLFASPRVMGQIIINPKDSPFAALYTFALYLVIRLFQERDSPSFGRLVGVGTAIGLTAGVRINGIILLGFAFLALADPVLKAVREGNIGRIVSLGGRFAAVVLPAWAMLVAFWPWAHGSPLSAPLESMAIMSNFPWEMPVLFGGTHIIADPLPREYFLHWFLIGTPLIVLLGLLAAPFVLALCRKHYRLKEAGLLALFLAVPLGAAVVGNAKKYDGLRHYHFLYATLIVFSALSIVLLFRIIRERFPQALLPAAAAAALLWVLPLKDAAGLHPYEYTYFNELAGGMEGACGQYETEYWMMSFGEAAEWLSGHAKPDEKVYVRLLNLDHFFDYYRERHSELAWSTEQDASTYEIASYRYNGCRKIDWPIFKTFGRDGCVFACIAKRSS